MKSSRGNSSSNSAVVNNVDKENTNSSPSVNLNPRQRAKQKYTEEQEQERTKESTPEVDMKNQENISDQITLTSRLEAVEQKLFKLQSLKDETLIEFSSILTELHGLIPVLNKLHPMNTIEDTISQYNESGLSKLLNRLQNLQYEYQKRRSVSEKRFNYRIEAVKERYAAELLHNKTESESEMAETSVALIHRHMAKGPSISGCSGIKFTESFSVSASNDKYGSVISARKRSLPAINQSTATCPPALKMARRQSVAAYPQNYISPELIIENSNNREVTNSSVLNLSQSILVTPKSVADADLLAIKSRISKALKR